MSPPPCSYDDGLDEEASEDFGTDPGSEDTETPSSEPEASIGRRGRAWPDPLDAGTDTSSPCGEEAAGSGAPLPRPDGGAAGGAAGGTAGGARAAEAPPGSPEEGHAPGRPRQPLGQPAAAAAGRPALGAAGRSEPSLASHGAAGGRTDRVALALSEAASRPSAASGQPTGWGCGLLAGAAPAALVDRRCRRNPGGGASWRRDPSSSRSSEAARRRGLKRRGLTEPTGPPRGPKEMRLHEQAPDFASMTSLEMSSYVRWWRKMHAATWQRAAPAGARPPPPREPAAAAPRGGAGGPGPAAPQERPEKAAAPAVDGAPAATF